ncbi:hypothetical protein NE237_001398 [Protea cynaroides]|uniref:Uncharacterized protein n=1 Tax=Protea cynaroides TaxID=273540 RepID=A0A9Q0KT96_9MAGN|nr:hypothetical protein NE237_001398 [Protea cynaroides]
MYGRCFGRRNIGKNFFLKIGLRQTKMQVLAEEPSSLLKQLEQKLDGTPEKIAEAEGGRVREERGKEVKAASEAEGGEDESKWRGTILTKQKEEKIAEAVTSPFSHKVSLCTGLILHHLNDSASVQKTYGFSSKYRVSLLVKLLLIIVLVIDYDSFQFWV